jgi:hypothetical protein
LSKKKSANKIVAFFLNNCFAQVIRHGRTVHENYPLPSQKDPNSEFEAIHNHLACKDSITIRKLFDTSTRGRWIAKCDLSKLVAMTTEAKATLNSPLESDLILMSLARDRVYQLFNEVQTKMHGANIEQTKNLINGQLPKPSSIKTVDELYVATAEKSLSNIVTVMYYASNLPRIESLSRNDIEALVHSMYYVIFSVFMNKLYIRGEMYMTLPDGSRLTREHRMLRFGEELAKRMIDSMEKLVRLTDGEIALLIPFLLTNNIGELFF